MVLLGEDSGTLEERLMITTKILKLLHFADKKTKAAQGMSPCSFG
jgi:hypothetical protein